MTSEEKKEIAKKVAIEVMVWREDSTFFRNWRPFTDFNQIQLIKRRMLALGFNFTLYNNIGSETDNRYKKYCCIFFKNGIAYSVNADLEEEAICKAALRAVE